MTKEKQRYGRNKETIIDHTYITSGAYKRKCDLISDNPKLNKIIYNLCKRMLVHRSGTEFEDMYWIDIESCEIIARELNQKKKKKISYSKHTKNAIKKYQHILTIHSHPSSGPPSIEDLNCNLKYGYDVGIVCCHNGKIYKYTSNQHINKVYYDLKINACFKKAEEERHYISNVEAQWIVLNELVERFDISVKEVL